MPTFRKKPEIVDARQFTGGTQNGTDLLYWIQSHNGRAMWEPKINDAPNGAEYIRLYDLPIMVIQRVAYVGDWVMLRQNGTFAVVRQQELNAEYEQV